MPVCNSVSVSQLSIYEYFHICRASQPVNKYSPIYHSYYNNYISLGGMLMIVILLHYMISIITIHCFSSIWHMALEMKIIKAGTDTMSSQLVYFILTLQEFFSSSDYTTLTIHILLKLTRLISIVTFICYKQFGLNVSYQLSVPADFHVMGRQG